MKSKDTKMIVPNLFPKTKIDTAINIWASILGLSIILRIVLFYIQLTN